MRREAETWFERGMERLKHGEMRGAFEALEQAVALDPNHARACKELARLSRQANEVRAFTNWLHEALRLDPADPEPHSMMAEALLEAGRREEAEEEILTARRLRDSGPG
jgi:Flp pilus assembly protein TadD